MLLIDRCTLLYICLQVVLPAHINTYSAQYAVTAEDDFASLVQYCNSVGRLLVKHNRLITIAAQDMVQLSFLLL